MTTKIEKIRGALARLTVKTPDGMLHLLIMGALGRQNNNPQEAEEVVKRMLNATTNAKGDVEIRYTLLCIAGVGKYLLSNSKEGYIRYLTKKRDATEIKKLKSAMGKHEMAVISGIPIDYDAPVVVKITMSKAVFLGLYHNMVDAETAWYHGEIVTEGENWLFHSIVLLNTFEIFRKTLGLPVPEEMQARDGGENGGGERETVAFV